LINLTGILKNRKIYLWWLLCWKY